jgi:hypothetical protein
MHTWMKGTASSGAPARDEQARCQQRRRHQDRRVHPSRNPRIPPKTNFLEQISEQLFAAPK